MNAKVLAVILYFITNFKICQGRNYTNYFLVSVNPKKMEQMKYLDTLQTQKYMDIKFWEKPNRLGRPVHLIVGPTDIGMFRERAKHFNLEYTVQMSNLQAAFDNQSTIAYQRLRPDTFSFEHFYVLEDIYQWLTDVSQNKSYTGIHLTIGKSAEGRDISMINININRNLNKPKVIVEGGIHGNEWVSVVFVTYLINELALAERSYDAAWKNFARAYNWYLIPVANPDGYEYTHKEDRLWRKNRNQLGDRAYGVDLNRNFDESFGKFSSSNDSISDNYCGPKPFSEPETKALSFFVTTNRNDLKYYFAFHAYGQKILIPYDDRVQHVDNFDEMENYGRQVVHKLYRRNHIKFAIGSLYDTTGTRMSGTSASWVKKHMKVKYVYTIRLRDNGTYGYALPSNQLLSTCKEGKIIMKELMTAKPRYVKALYEDDAIINAPCPLLTIIVLLITLK